jgi:D-arabinose 1-dehydrogenase-like Zn-dependent alcohol dehydrogenase
VVDGELPNPRLPIVPGHEIVGHVAALGPGVTGFKLGECVGVPWLGATCGVCPYCHSERENLCDRPIFTGYLATAAMRPIPWLTRGSVSRYRRNLMKRKRRRFCAPA